MTTKPYKFAPLPRQWPGRVRPQGWKPTRSKFKSHAWGRIEKELLSELAHLKAKDITLALDLVGPGNLREDGMLRSDARPATSRVLLTFTRSQQGVKLTFPCDTYAYWEDNVWAIRLTLKHLRSIDRYGVTQGDQQYVGFTALPSGAKEEMTVDAAVTLLADTGDAANVDLISAPDWLLDAVKKRARAVAHPDAGGTTEAFQLIEEAVRIIEVARLER